MVQVDFQSCPKPLNKLSKFTQKHLADIVLHMHMHKSTHTNKHPLHEGMCPKFFTTYNSVSWWGWEEAWLVINEEEFLAMSGELGSEIFRMRMLHIPWKLKRPKYTAKGDCLRSGNITLLNRHFDSQYFSISS